MTTHHHVITHANDDDPYVTRSLVSALDYVATELDGAAENAHNDISAYGDNGLYQNAYTAWQRSETYNGLALNAANLVKQAGDAAGRAPLYRSEPVCGPRWQVAVEHFRNELSATGPAGFYFYPCELDECSPGAWVVRQDTTDVAAYARDDFDSAWSRYVELAREWADGSDEDYESSIPADDNPGCRQGSHDQTCTWFEEFGNTHGTDRATVDSMLNDFVLTSRARGVREQDYRMSINANDGSSVVFTITWDADADPDE
jgi:hypothetical protein